MFYRNFFIVKCFSKSLLVRIVLTGMVFEVLFKKRAAVLYRV